MIKCPSCNSSKVRKYDWDIEFDGDDEITIYRDYVCPDCGHLFKTARFYHADGWEMVCEEDE
jgi:acetone carboxylase gamma subunit